MNDEIFRSIFYNPTNSASFGSPLSLYRASKKIDNSITLKQVKEWLKGEFTYTLHKQVRKNFKRNPIIVKGIDDQWEADLVDMQEFAPQNSNNKYLLTVIDVFSKYAWVKAVKNKTAKEVIFAFNDIIKDGRKPVRLRTDNGREFVNKLLKNFLQTKKILHFTSNNVEIKCAVVERFNRTLKSKMFKYFTFKGTRKYINVIDDLVYAYNRSYHRSIKMSPVNVNENNQSIVFKNLYGVNTLTELKNIRSKANLKSKDLVRKQYHLNNFDKSYFPNWPDRIFEVQSVYKGKEKPVYTISDDTPKRYYPEQLQVVKNNLFRVEKVLRTKILNGKKQFYVKWIGYPNHYNSWVDESDVVKL
jgi:hypothetical protein